jgi:hypothetical protein
MGGAVTMPEARPGGDSVESTRYLCAAAYLDSRYAQAVARTLLREDWRAIAPHFGVDVVPVLRHCLAARRRRLYRDLILSVLVFAAVIAVWQGMSAVAAIARLVLLGWAVVFAADCLDRFQALPNLQRHRFVAEDAPAPSSTEASALAKFHRLASGNVTVYQGFHPFAGAGIRGESWSFVTDISKGKPGIGGVRTPIPFTIEELYRSVSASLQALNIPALRIEDRIFINGSDAHRQTWLFDTSDSRPNTNVDRDQIDDIMRLPTEDARHYLTMQIVDWRGEMVVTLHLRFAISDHYLFTEAAYCLLPSLRESYREVDGMGALPELGSSFKVIGRSAVSAVPRMALAPFRVARDVYFSSAPDSKRALADPTLDYGAAPSLREEATSGQYRRYFQKVDHDMHTKLIEKRMLDALNEFLDDHGIDTTSTREQQVNIINSGVMMSGGSLTADSLAVGNKAKAQATRIVHSVSKKLDSMPLGGNSHGKI